MKHAKIARIGPKSGKLLRALMRGHASPVLRGRREAARPEPVPDSMAGRYVVWSPDGLRIVGHGKTIAEARAMAGPSGGVRRVVQKIPAVRRFRPADGVAIGAGAAEAGIDPSKS